jgi:peptidase M28-like protein
MAIQSLMCAVLAVVSAPDLRSRGAAGLASIRPAEISAHVRFLADDLLEGREPGTRGHAIAERYVATQLAALGLEPAGDGGTFFQAVPLRATRVAPKDMRLDVLGRRGTALRLVPERDVVLFSAGHEPTVSVDAPLVFAGFGITAPEYGHDDLAGLDLRGKIAVVLFGAPRSDDTGYFPGVASAWYARRRDKAERLRHRGAIGMLSVWTPAAEKLYPWAQLVRDARSLDAMEWLDGDHPGTWPAGLPVLGAMTTGALDRALAAAGVRTSAAELLARAGERKPTGLALGVTARVRSRTRFRELRANNVVAILRGSDPVLAREAVVYTAHLDHLGIGEPASGDAIYNGAVDNATGVAGMLGVARAFSAGPRPPRSVLFVATTGEENGYLGSEYFARRPTVASESIVANINLDALPFFPSRDLVAFGADHSTLGAHARAAADAMGIALSPDPFPELMLFIRSDQVNFVKEGTPALWMFGGVKDERGDAAANTAAWSEYMEKRYHQPSDEWSPSLDFDAMARVTGAAFLAGLSIAAADERPRWNEGDIFERFATPRGASR